jgi:hypothetical protein
MTEGDALSPGDEWPHHYRGFSLQVSPDREVWWQLYQGTDRLVLEPAPEEVVEQLLELKRIGGRMHVTEQGDVLTRVEAGDDEYEQVYLGTVDSLDGDLVPGDAPEYSIELRPTGLDPGDLWPSVYDGSRYSFVGDRFWWHSGQSHKRHPVPDGLTSEIENNLRRYKPDGGSFRVLPWGDVITLVSLHPTPDKVGEQFNELPRVVRNIIKLRKDRDVEMLPIYVGSLGDYRIDVTEPSSLTDSLSQEEQESLSSWAENLGRTSSRSAEDHQASRTNDEADSPSRLQSLNGSDSSSNNRPSPPESVNEAGDGDESDSRESADDSNDDPGSFGDDPMEWIRSDIEGWDNEKAKPEENRD